MGNLKAEFEQAVEESKNLAEKPDNQTLLKMYALYKQATRGDVEGKRPGFGDLVGRAKWDTWNEIEGQERRAGDARVHRADRIVEVMRDADREAGVEV